MTFEKCVSVWMSVFILLCFFPLHSARAAEGSQEESVLEKNKKEILGNIDLFERSMHKTRSCVNEATTMEELEQCRVNEAETEKKVERVNDMLQEIGMTPEERRLYELRPERYR